MIPHRRLACNVAEDEKLSRLQLVHGLMFCLGLLFLMNDLRIFEVELRVKSGDFIYFMQSLKLIKSKKYDFLLYCC